MTSLKMHRPEVSFVLVSAGFAHTCGVKADGSVACWGRNGSGQATPPEGQFESVTAGGGHTCGLRAGRSVACWGEDAYGESIPPEGEFESVSAGFAFTPAALRPTARWPAGVRHWYGQATAPEGQFKSVSAGSSHTCGVKADGSVACWGYERYGEATPPEGRFESVNAGGRPHLWVEDRRLGGLLGSPGPRDDCPACGRR